MVKPSEKPLLQVAFGLAVRKHRKALGFSQEAFADACGIDRSYMGGVERGERNLALLNIGRIIEALNMSPSTFFSFMDAGNMTDLEIKIRADEEQKALRSKHGKVLETAPKTTDTL